MCESNDHLFDHGRGGLVGQYSQLSPTAPLSPCCFSAKIDIDQKKMSRLEKKVKKRKKSSISTQ